MTYFRNRVEELTLLKNLYNKKEAKLIVMYGRRRVGKTEILREFIKKNNGLYLLARQEAELEQLKTLSSQIAEHFGDSVLKINPLLSWDAFFTYLINKPKIPIIFDEFPYIIQSARQVASILQGYWDNNFSKNNSFIILCGSSITMMESLLGHKSPIYGRRTEQLLIEPLKFKDACLFFPEKLNIKDKIIFYSVLGGMPAYLLEFDFNKNLRENLIFNLLKKNKLLYNDVFFVLKEELKEPRNYFSILESIARGNTRIGQIVNDTGLDKSFVNKYISVLIDLQLIERRLPITEINKRKSRQGIYLLKDNFLKFWFKFVFGNQEYIEQEKQEILVNDIILPEINSFVGRIFEDIVISVISKNQHFKDYLFGRWWDKNEEADIVGIDKKNKKILIGEIKFKDLTSKDIKNILNSLKLKSRLINKFGFKESLIIVCLKCNYKSEEIRIIEFKELLT